MDEEGGGGGQGMTIERSKTIVAIQQWRWCCICVIFFRDILIQYALETRC